MGGCGWVLGGRWCLCSVSMEGWEVGGWMGVAGCWEAGGACVGMERYYAMHDSHRRAEVGVCTGPGMPGQG